MKIEMKEPIVVEEFMSLSRCEAIALVRRLNEIQRDTILGVFAIGYRQSNLNNIRSNMPADEMLLETAYRLEQFGIEMTIKEAAHYFAKMLSGCIQDEEKVLCKSTERNNK